jgi:hypothetical protein
VGGGRVGWITAAVGQKGPYQSGPLRGVSFFCLNGRGGGERARVHSPPHRQRARPRWRLRGARGALHTPHARQAKECGAACVRGDGVGRKGPPSNSERPKQGWGVCGGGGGGLWWCGAARHRPSAGAALDVVWRSRHRLVTAKLSVCLTGAKTAGRLRPPASGRAAAPRACSPCSVVGGGLAVEHRGQHRLVVHRAAHHLGIYDVVV